MAVSRLVFLTPYVLPPSQQVESVFGLIGASCSVALSFVIPSLLYRRLVWFGDRRLHASEAAHGAAHDMEMHGMHGDGSSSGAGESDPIDDFGGGSGCASDLSCPDTPLHPSDDPPSRAALVPRVSRRRGGGHGATADVPTWAGPFAVYGSIAFGLGLAAISLPLQISELFAKDALNENVLEHLDHVALAAVN